MISILNYSWTSTKAIKGLRHFVLLNHYIDNAKEFFQMVSVLDEEINITISKKEIQNSELWEEGWQELEKNESITSDYEDFKKSKNPSFHEEIFINKKSEFYIS